MPPFRSTAFTVTVGIVAGLVAFWVGLGSIGVLAASDTRIHNRGGAAAVLLLITAVLVAVAVRAFRAGIVATSDAVVVRFLSLSRRIPVADVAGFAAQPVVGGRYWQAALVTVDGTVIGCGWTAVRTISQQWAGQLAHWDQVFDRPSVHRPTREVLADASRLAGQTPPPLSTVHFRPPPQWPPPPPGWSPPPGWMPPPEWPAAAPDWQWWDVRSLPVATAPALLGRDSAPPVVDQPLRKTLKIETIVVMVAFLLPAIAGALIGLIEDLVGQQKLDNFALPLSGHVTVSLLILILSYVPLAASVPVALLLLSRSGVSLRSLGLRPREALADIPPAVGIAIAAWFFAAIVSIILNAALHGSRAENNPHETHVPAYFVIYAIILAATTAITEEVFVNGYLLTRLAQLDWRPWPAFALSLTLRTSYHLYYGVAIVATIPFGWLVTRSFQKHGRLARPILAHFIYDATILTIAVLTS